jgi:hypothetical protein
MRGAILPQPQYAFMAWCSVKNNFTFTFFHKLEKKNIKEAEGK